MTRRHAFAALLPLTLCWSQASLAVAQQQTPQPQPSTPAPVVAGTLPPQTFGPPAPRLDLTPRPLLPADTTLSNRNQQPIFGPRDPAPSTRDQDLRFGPIILRESEKPQEGCRFGLRGNRLRMRCGF